MPPARDDLRLLLFAGAAVIFAGIAVAAALLFSTSRGDDDQTRTPEPVRLGFESSAKDRVEEDPDFIPDQFGGDRSFWLTLEHGNVVAIAVNPSDMSDCTVDWKGQLDRFVCGGQRFRSEELERFEVRVPAAGEDEGVLIVDVRHRLPAPSIPAG